MLRMKKIVAEVAVGVCAVAVVGSAVAPVASADYVAPLASACKAVNTSSASAVQAARNAEVFYKGETLQLRRRDDKRRWEIHVLSGRQVFRAWADYAGQLTEETSWETTAATEDEREVMEDSTVTVRRAVMQHAPDDSVLRYARLTGDDDDSVIMLQFDDASGIPLATVMVDAETGVVLDSEDMD